MMPFGPITVADPFFTEQDRERIHAGVDEILSGQLSMGPNVQAFEKEFAEAVGVRHAVALNACTSALEIALFALGIQPGDEIIIPAETFIATGMAVYLSGGIPVFAEIREETLCLDPKDVLRRITPRTRGVIQVYFAGLIPSDTDELRAVCKQNGLFLLEDAAHAPGARLGGQAAGTLGDAACFSFFPTKVLTAGEGGMLTTNRDDVAATGRSLQHRGRDWSSPIESYALAGRNVRMPEMSALLGRVQLSHLDEYLEERRRVVRIYRERLAGEERVRLILPEDEQASAFWKVPLLLSPDVDRVAVTSYLHGLGVFADWTYQPALHLQPAFQRLLGTHPGMLPRTEALLERILCLPCHPRITNEQAAYVADTLLASLAATVQLV